MVRVQVSEIASQLEADSTESLIERSRQIVQESVKQSSIFDEDREARIPHFEPEELVLGHVLGRGGFCAVRELNSVKVQPSHDQPRSRKLSMLFCFRDKSLQCPSTVLDNNGTGEHDSQTDALSDRSIPRERLAKYVSSRKGATSRYVVKQVNEELQYTDKVAFLKAMVDIELEAKYMASLNHPNILNIRGLSVANPAKGQTVFLVLDRLKETLGKRMQDWMRRDRQCKGITGAVVGSKKKRDDLWEERLVAAHNIADAVDYLHGRNIIFRDLKPDNIGFNYNANLKLFDFGLSREIREEDKVKGGLYKLTGFTGAIRYMAPEVGLRKPYNLKADVYSWSMLMWYILELEPPLGVYTPQMFKERVFKKGTRPAVMDYWPPLIPNLLKKCWHAEIKERADFKEIKQVLSTELASYNTSKFLPNRLEEPQVPGQTKRTHKKPYQESSTESVNSSSIPQDLSSGSPPASPIPISEHQDCCGHRPAEPDKCLPPTIPQAS